MHLVQLASCSMHRPRHAEVHSMAERHGFRIESVPMKNTHHELIRKSLVLKP